MKRARWFAEVVAYVDGLDSSTLTPAETLLEELGIDAL